MTFSHRKIISFGISLDVVMEHETLDSLPEDCLIIIFQKLESIINKNAFGLTCRRLCQIKDQDRKSLDLQLVADPKAYYIYGSILPRILARSPRLTSISLSGCIDLPDSTLILLRDSGATLRSLSFYCCTSITDHGLALISSGCPNLVSVTLHRCNIMDYGLESLAKSCRAIEKMNLSHCVLISDYGINALLSECLKLRVLMISHCRGITGTGFNGCAETLAYLEAGSCLLTPEGISGVVSGGGLGYLNVSNIRSWIGKDSLNVIGFATRLRFLNLRLCRFVHDDTVATIAEGCPLLEEWSLALCHGVHVAGWQAVGLKCRNLNVLHVNKCRNLCDQGLHAIRDGCRRLQVLYMNGCQRVTLAGLEMFKLQRQDVTFRTEECVSIGPSAFAW